ncbi:MAG: glycosyltransferase family 9 protein [Planctomycetes bacterium]|nr:glycosyltransferase family 9 protein [Planctomycetota bacterium]
MTDLNFKRILIVRLSALGDVINTFPALAVLRRNFPKSFIAWVVEDKAKDILEGHPDIDKVFVFRRRDWKINLTNPAKFLKMTKDVPEFIKELKAEKFDIALDFQGNLKSGIISYLSGAKVKAGFEKPATREFNHLFSNHKVHLDSLRVNRVAKNLLLLKGLGFDISDYKVNLPVEKNDERYFSEFKKRYMKAGASIVVAHPGVSAFGAYKKWQPENYAVLGDRLIKELKCNFIITGGRGEEGLIKLIASKMKEQPIINYETTPLSKFTALLKKTDLFVGSDTGPLHLANLIGVPVIALFGPKDPVLYGPYAVGKNNNVTIVRKDLPCSPCPKRKCSNPKCMTSITVEDVFNAARRILKND